MEAPFSVSNDVFGCGSASKLFCFMATTTTEEEGTDREDFFLDMWDEEDEEDDDKDEGEEEDKGEGKSGVDETLADWMAWMIKSEGRVALARSICHLLEGDSKWEARERSRGERVVGWAESLLCDCLCMSFRSFSSSMPYE